MCMLCVALFVFTYESVSHGVLFLPLSLSLSLTVIPCFTLRVAAAAPPCLL